MQALVHLTPLLLSALPLVRFTFARPARPPEERSGQTQRQRAAEYLPYLGLLVRPS